MKVLIYIFLVLAAGLLIFNLYHVNFEEPLEGESFAAMVGVGASLCAIILLTILKIALNIKEKLKG
jgi:phosphoglycerol transferase MdoB-like AlkP superfamily enzyme